MRRKCSPTEAYAGIIDFGGGGQSSLNYSFFSTAGDDFVTVAEAIIELTGPAQMTFAVLSDDGFGLTIDGTSLLPLLRGEEPRRAVLFSELSRSLELRAVVQNNWKLIVNRREPHRSLLFDLALDPGESINFIEQEPERVRELYGRIASTLLAAEKGRRPSPRIDLSRDEVERLRALGYVQ